MRLGLAKAFECDFDAKQICAKNQMRHEQVVTHIKLESMRYTHMYSCCNGATAT